MSLSLGKKLTFLDPPNFQLPLFRIQRLISSVRIPRATSDAFTVLKAHTFSEYLESVQSQNTVGSRAQKHRAKSSRMNTCAKTVGGVPRLPKPLFRQDCRCSSVAVVPRM